MLYLPTEKLVSKKRDNSFEIKGNNNMAKLNKLIKYIIAVLWHNSAECTIL